MENKTEIGREINVKGEMALWQGGVKTIFPLLWKVGSREGGIMIFVTRWDNQLSENMEKASDMRIIKKSVLRLRKTSRNKKKHEKCK